jgi:hypothetical protein
MARQPKPTPENRWNLTEKEIEAVRVQYVEERCTLQRTAYRTGVKESVVAMVCKHHRWTRSAWDRPRHKWMREMGAARQERDSRGER